MRALEKKEIVKRGREFCTEMKERGTRKQMYCLHMECPYHELDNYETYADYIKKYKSKH